MARYRRFDLTTTKAQSPEALDAVKMRRAGLRAAMLQLERALDAPAPGRSAEWAAGVRDALGVLEEVWTRHVVDTETPGAFLDELTQAEPRLANQVQRLRDEHGKILSAVLTAEDDLASEPVDTERVRTTVTWLLGELHRHRQRGADLVYEAFDVDIGGGA